MRFVKFKNQKGQSLVEMAITAPLLIFFLLGIFEVGVSVRNYLTLVNVNREITRFAVRPGYLSFSEGENGLVIPPNYELVREWAESSVSDQLNLDFNGSITDTESTTLIVSYFTINTGFPCIKYKPNKDPIIPYEFDPACDCSNGDPSDPDGDGTPWFGKDDSIHHVGTDGDFYRDSFGPEESVTGSRKSRIIPDDLAAELVENNNKFNCEVWKKGGVPSNNNAIVTELFHDQPQLFGFPLISNPFTDPVPLYTHTTMRILGGTRGYSYEVDGPVCAVYPFTFDESIFDDPDNPDYPQEIDAFEGGGSGDKGWLTWNPAENDAVYVAEELHNPLLSRTDFTNVDDPDDHSLSIGDYVSTKTGVANSQDVADLLEYIYNEGKPIYVPVYDVWGGAPDRKYRISHFAEVQITEVCLPRFKSPGCTPGSKEITANFLGYVDNLCDADLP